MVAEVVVVVPVFIFYISRKKAVIYNPSWLNDLELIVADSILYLSHSLYSSIWRLEKVVFALT